MTVLLMVYEKDVNAFRDKVFLQVRKYVGWSSKMGPDDMQDYDFATWRPLISSIAQHIECVQRQDR